MKSSRGLEASMNFLPYPCVKTLKKTNKIEMTPNISRWFHHFLFASLFASLARRWSFEGLQREIRTDWWLHAVELENPFVFWMWNPGFKAAVGLRAAKAFLQWHVCETIQWISTSYNTLCYAWNQEYTIFRLNWWTHFLMRLPSSYFPGFRGDFTRFHMIPGRYEYNEVLANQFLVTIRRRDQTVFSQVLSPLRPKGMFLPTNF